MQANPLQRFFRQPKIYIKLPSLGYYNKPGTIQGDAAKLPVFSMTGMDEILVKTPDAMLSGESVVKLVESCVPSVKDAWDMSSIDMNLVMIAIRIATYGNEISVGHKCSQCGAEHDYDISLNKFVEYFNSCSYKPSVELREMTVKLKPLSYKTVTDLALKGFKVRKQASAILAMEEDQRNEDQLNVLYKELVKIQNEIFIASVDSVEIADQNVTEQKYILEWLTNCDSEVYDTIKEQAEKNMEIWAVPPVDVVCDQCQHTDKITVDLDYSSFFAKA